MHHSLKLYSRYREKVLHLYMFFAAWTRIPLIGYLVRYVANTFGKRMESAYLLTTEEACDIVELSRQLYLGPCTCREVFKNCDNPVMTEIMIGFHSHAFVDERPEDYRKLSVEEAKVVLKQCHELGLIHTIIRCRNEFYAICNCCSCCCVPLRLKNQYGIGNALSRPDDVVGLFRDSIAVQDDHESEHEHTHTH
ncbi:MAG: ferredoxin-like protein [Dehalococcoidales bacterium]|nr:ferredoxin-like protein [Dehalococcoidales bacterium]